MGKIIVVLASILIVSAYTAHSARQSSAVISHRANEIGKYLIEKIALSSQKTENRQIVFLGKAVRSKFKSLSNSLREGYRTKVIDSDLTAPHGDGSASHHIIIFNDQKKLLALRLRYDERLDKFHILGFVSY